MSGDANVKSREEAIDCVVSLNQAILDAGGTPLVFESLRGISLLDFITKIAAQNHIRFYFDNPEKKETVDD